MAGYSGDDTLDSFTISGTLIFTFDDADLTIVNGVNTVNTNNEFFIGGSG